MAKTNFNMIHNNLTFELEKYITAIVEEYGSYMSEEQLLKLQNIKSYDEIIKIHDYGSINGFASTTTINLPLSADIVFDKLRKVPGYGINKKHIPYNDKTIILNDNTFFDYIIHTFVSGKDTETYYKDLLLHETMHYCGSGGAGALNEGMNEYLTRKLALKKGFRTNGCAYPKEVKMVYELEQLFGEETINRLAFMNNIFEQTKFLEGFYGKRERDLYMDISYSMNNEFQNKYYSHMDSYDGLKGIFMKTINYGKIDYSESYDIINTYKEEKSVIPMQKSK